MTEWMAASTAAFVRRRLPVNPSPCPFTITTTRPRSAVPHLTGPFPRRRLHGCIHADIYVCEAGRPALRGDITTCTMTTKHRSAQDSDSSNDRTTIIAFYVMIAALGGGFLYMLVMLLS